MPGGEEAEGDLFQGEGRGGHRDTHLGGEHQVEPAAAAVTVDRRDERLAEVEGRQRGRAHRAKPLEVVRVDLFASREGLGDGDRLAKVHPAAEHAFPRARQHHGPHLVVGRELSPRGRELAQRRRIQRVRPLGPVDGDKGDMAMALRPLDTNQHPPPISRRKNRGQERFPPAPRPRRKTAPDPDLWRGHFSGWGEWVRIRGL